jgi:hypothetical protein
MTRIAIVGSRNFSKPELVFNFVKQLSEDTVIVSGGARGVDTWAELAAKKRGLGLLVFPAEWDKYGKRAGYLRNITIVENCDKVVAFWDGQSRGTQHTVSIAKSKNIPVKIITE